MPRDANGTYTLPLPPVIGGTIIDTNWANPTLDDVMVALTASLSRNGNGGMLQPLKLTNGAVGNPSLTFTSSPRAGLYLGATDEVRMSANAIDQMRWFDNETQMWDEEQQAWFDVLSTKDTGAALETQSLSSGQTQVVFVNNLAGASLYINGADADDGRLLVGVNYTYDSGTFTVTLDESYPEGTLLTAQRIDGNDPVPIGEIIIYDTVEVLKLADLSAGSYVGTKGYYAAGDGGHAAYLIAINQIVDGYGSHLLTNGNVAILQHVNGEINSQHFGTYGDGIMDDDAAFIAVVDACKATGLTLVSPAGMYNAALNIDWALTRTQVDSLTANPSYDPGTLNQPGYIGLAFNVRMDRAATFMKQCEFSRIRGPVTISGGEFLDNVVFCANLAVNFDSMITTGTTSVAALSYYSSTPGNPRYPLRYMDQFNNLANGASYWIKYSDCVFSRGIVMGGSVADGFNLNMIESVNCLYTGGDSTIHPVGSYLDTHGAGCYMEGVSGHFDGMTFIGVDFSYGEMPLWNNTPQVVQVIGCYYEGCTVLNAYTNDGLTPSNLACNIQYGFDYDRDDIEGRDNNTRTGLRCSTFNLSAYPTTEKSTIAIPDFGGAVTFTDISNTKDIGSISNTSQQDGVGNCMVMSSFTNRAGVREQVARIMSRTYQNFNVSGCFWELTIPANGATVRSFLCNDVGELGANGSIKISAMGAPQDNSPASPYVQEFSITKTSAGSWTYTNIYGVTSPRVSITLGSAGASNSDITIQINNTSVTGSWTGILHVECNIASSTKNPDGTETRWNAVTVGP